MRRRPLVRGISGSRGLVLSAVVVLALSGCTAVSDGPEPEATLPAGVSAELLQQRSDVAAREAQLQITNNTAETLVVESIEAIDPRFEAAIVRALPDRVTTVRPGSRVNIRMQLPAVTCESPPPRSPDATEVTLAYRLADRAGEVVVRVGEAIPFLEALHRRECDAVALSEAADVALVAFTPSPPGVAAELSLSITPSGEGGAGILSIRSTNLLAFEGHPASYPLDIDTASDAEARMIPLPIVPARCDPHAVLEDKRGTIFTLDVELDGEPTSVELFGGDEMRGDILSWVSAWCAG